MALTERKEIGSMNVLPMGQIEVRTDTIIEKDGVELSRSYHRHIVAPHISEGDLAKEDARVKAIVTVVHTPEIKTAWTEYLARPGAYREEGE